MKAAFCVALILPAAAGLGQADFGAARLAAGKEAFKQKRFSQAIEEFRVAAFGLLDEPSRLLECLARQAVAEQAGGRSLEERRPTINRFLDVERRFHLYREIDLEPEIRQAFGAILSRDVPRESLASLSELGVASALAAGRAPASPPPSPPSTTRPPETPGFPPRSTSREVAEVTPERDANSMMVTKSASAIKGLASEPPPLTPATTAPSLTPTAAATDTPVPTKIPVPATATFLLTDTPTPMPTQTPIPPTATPVPTDTPTQIPTPTRTPIPPTRTRVPTDTPTAVPTSTSTRTPAPPSATRVPTWTPWPTRTPRPSVTATPAAEATKPPDRTPRPSTSATPAAEAPKPPDRTPRPVFAPSPDYPAEDLKTRTRGLVVLQVLVTEAGTPAEVVVVKAARGHLTEAAVAAVRSWRFEPATAGGKSVRAWTTVEIPFEAIPYPTARELATPTPSPKTR